MMGRGLFLLTVLSNCVLSLPVTLTSSQLENEDVEVMKCIVEALADVLSRPHLVPTSQGCLVTLKSDDRLLTILRHHNFLKELQEIAVQGPLLQRHADAPTPTMKAPHKADVVADRSMLDALGGPGERSILSQRKRVGNGRGEKDESGEDRKSQEDSEAEEAEPKRGKDEAENSEEEGEKEGHDEKRAEENSEEEMEVKDERGDGKKAPSRNKSTKRMFVMEDDEESDNKSALLSQKQSSKEQEKEEKENEEKEEDDDRMKRGGREDLKRWTKTAKSLQLKKKAIRKEEQQEFNGQQEVPHHSKEVMEEAGEEKKKKKINALRSPEEKELQMIAHRSPEEKKGVEEEGSGSRKPEEPEIESLATIESELENVAQKLHELRRG